MLFDKALESYLCAYSLGELTLVVYLYEEVELSPELVESKAG